MVRKISGVSILASTLQVAHAAAPPCLLVPPPFCAAPCISVPPSGHQSGKHYTRVDGHQTGFRGMDRVSSLATAITRVIVRPRPRATGRRAV